MANDHVQVALQALLGQMTDAQKASINPVLAMLGQPPLAVAEPVAVIEQKPAADLTSQEVLLVKLLREFEASTEDGKKLVSLLGKFQRFVQSSTA
jgi:hypothetical protein